MIAELFCTVCFANKPKYVRQCKCFYCEDCKSKSSECCGCGSAGNFTSLSQNIPDEYKYVAIDTAQLVKKLFETLTEKINSQLIGYSNYFANILEVKSHHEKQLHRFLLTKIKSLENEVENLKKRGGVQPPFEIKENFPISQLEQFKFSTPRGTKPGVSNGSGLKKPFLHEGFANFFGKK